MMKKLLTCLSLAALLGFLSANLMANNIATKDNSSSLDSGKARKCTKKLNKSKTKAEKDKEKAEAKAKAAAKARAKAEAKARAEAEAEENDIDEDDEIEGEDRKNKAEKSTSASSAADKIKKDLEVIEKRAKDLAISNENTHKALKRANEELAKLGAHAVEIEGTNMTNEDGNPKANSQVQSTVQPQIQSAPVPQYASPTPQPPVQYAPNQYVSR